jgi:UDP-sulfoquinovose synthase
MGGQGYLGWSLGLSLSLSSDADVILLDNQSKQEWARRAGGTALNGGLPMTDRLAALEAECGRSIVSLRVNADVYSELFEAIEATAPDVIVNCAHQPSAPYSELSAETSAFTLKNNVSTHLNVLWSLKSLGRPVKYVELNSAGAFGDIDVDLVPPQKVPLTFTLDGLEHRIADAWPPMQASDVYHLSKAQNFMLSEMFASRFGLTITSVRQSVLFGLAPLHRPLPPALLPTMYYDPVFGTVANRFMLQHAAGVRPTVYGDGRQRTGLIWLDDAVDSLKRVCLSPGTPGKLQMVHNQTCTLSIAEIAALIEGGPAAAAEIACRQRSGRRLAPTRPGPPLRKLVDIATQFGCFRQRVEPFVRELDLERLAAVCPRRGY